MTRLLLLNPNTNAATTRSMVEIAREAVGEAAMVDGMTAAAGARVITEPAALADAAGEVARMAGSAAALAADGVLVAAFGDPGLEAARARLGARAVGLAEAAIAAASAGGRRFSIVTTTPALDAAIRDRVAAGGAASAFAGLRYTRSGVAGMDDPGRLLEELEAACAAAVAQDGAEAVIIGGGPLAAAARRLRGRVGAELIEPIPVAARWMLARDAAGGTGVLLGS